MHCYDACAAIFPAQFGIHMLTFLDVSLGVLRICNWWEIVKLPWATGWAQPLTQRMPQSYIYVSWDVGVTIIGVQLVAIYPSSNAKNLPAEPESLDMNTIVPTGMPLCISSFWATRIGPIVFVFKWSSKSWKDLHIINASIS